MRHIEIAHAEEDDVVVHYEGPFPEFTLCGDAIEVDAHAARAEPSVTTKRVSCDRCIAVVRHVRGR